MSRSPREIAELTRDMVAGKAGVAFVDLFAPDGIMEFPFAPPGFPDALRGRDEVRAFYERAAGVRSTFDLHDVSLVVHQTDDPEVVVTEIEHHGHSHVTNGPYRMLAIGIVRVRDGQIVHYRDFMNPLTLAELTGRDLTATGTGAER